jgi:hypothetical protein
MPAFDGATSDRRAAGGARASRSQLLAGETCSLKYGDGRRGGARPSRSQLSAVPIQSNQVHNARRAVACIHIFHSRAIAGKMPALLLVATDQLCKQLRAGRPRSSRSTSTCDGRSRLTPLLRLCHANFNKRSILRSMLQKDLTGLG